MITDGFTTTLIRPVYHESTFGFIGLYEVRTNLLQFLQTLIHSQSISQCSSSLNSSFIQFKTVEEIIPELVQGMKINYYIVHDKTSCFMSKPLHQSGWVDKQLCKNQGVALYDYYLFIIIVVSLHLISTHIPAAMFQRDYKEWIRLQPLVWTL